MDQNELENIKKYYGTKLRCLKKEEPYDKNPSFEKKLLKTDYSYEEWKIIIQSLESIKDERLNEGDYDPSKFDNLNIDPIHFFYELLQNADDCNASEIYIEITLDKISFRHNGSKLFSLKDLLNICSLGQSDKEETKIGKFGVGFKTVFSFCEEPIIKCQNGCNFRLKERVIPEFIEGNKDGIDTAFILHIDGKKIEDAFLNKLKELDIDWNILLFLNKISSVNVKNTISGEDYLLKKEKSGDNICCLKKNGDVLSSWLKKAYDLDELKKKYNLPMVPKIIVAIYLEDDILTPLKNLEDNRFYLYMPFESEINPFKFLIHADFECILNRGGFIRKGYNEEIFQCIKEKIFDLIDNLSKHSEYEHSFLNVLPLPNDKDFKDEFYSNFPEEISAFVKDKIVFTDNFGEKINNPNISHIANADIVETINDDEKLIKGISKTLVNFKLHEFTFEFIKRWKIMPVFSIDDFIDEIKPIDLSYKSNNWFIKLFIKFNDRLINIENGKKKDNVNSEKYAELDEQYNNLIEKIQNLKIYRDENRNLGHLLYDELYDEIKVVRYFFLPDDEETKLDPDGYSLFKEKLTFLNEELFRNENEDLLTSFFKRIGVNNFNPRAVIDSYILMEFDNFINKRGDVNEDDLFSYITYIFKNYINDDKILDESSKKIPLKTKDNKWILPTKIYFSSQYFPETDPSHYLEEIFSSINNTNFLDPEYITKIRFNIEINFGEIIKFFMELGVEDKPRIETVKINKDGFNRYEDEYKTFINKEMDQKKIRQNWMNRPQFDVKTCFDYTSNNIISFLELDLEDTKKEDLYKKLILLLDSKWNYYQIHQIKLTGEYWTSNSYAYKTEISIKTNSVIESLLGLKWIPSTGGFRCPKQVFYNEEGLQLIPNQHYLFGVELKNEDFINTFFQKEDIKNIIQVISTIKDLNIDFEEKLEKLIGILMFLSKKEVGDDLKDKEIILVYEGCEKWYSINKVFWNYSEQNINLLGERGFISDKYPDELYFLFTSLGMRDECNIEDYLERLKELNEFYKEGFNEIEFKKNIDIIYGIIEDLLENNQDIEDQIEDFKNNGVVYCEDGEFRKLNVTSKIFFNDNKQLYERFGRKYENLKQCFIDADYKKFPLFFKKLGFYSFRDSAKKELIEGSIKHLPVEDNLFDLKNIGKYVIDIFKNVHKNRKLTDKDMQKISDFASVKVKYAECIPVRYYIEQLDNFDIINGENYLYHAESKIIFIKNSKEKHKKIIGIAKGLCDLFLISQTHAPFFEYVIENSKNAQKIEEYLEAHEIDLENYVAGEGEAGEGEAGEGETGEGEAGEGEAGEGEEVGNKKFTFEELLEKCKFSPPDTEERSEKIIEITKRQRNATFGKAIKQIYEDKCAVCGLIAYDLKRNPEAQWAHIKPVSKPHYGPDDIRNGFALCRFHHWAFDKGLFALSDDYNIIVKENLPENGNYEKLTQFEGKKIFIPADSFKPATKFLKYHRDNIFKI